MDGREGKREEARWLKPPRKARRKGGK